MGYTQETPARTIRESVKEITSFSSQLNSFETHLKAAAFHILLRSEINPISTSAVCLIAVGADWTNREPLLGYPNSLEPNTYVIPENGALQLLINAVNNPDLPHFLILDEMNLSHVERYFADFLSAMESKEPIFLHSGDSDHNGIPSSIVLPNNLFIIGTVNIDETTYMFSPKVLDRANVIEFRINDSEMQVFLENSSNSDIENITGLGASMANDFLVKSKNKYQSSNFNVSKELLDFFNELKKVGAEFGYRTASEIIRFVAVTNQINNKWTKEQIIDAAIMQKLLPKLHGSRRKLEATLKSLAEICLHDKSLVNDVLNQKKEFDFTDLNKVKFPISLEKIIRISNNFTSYAEA
jgi:5-methylcytosine-specific restriction protein B